MGKTSIADNIKLQRIKNSLTQQDLADKMYVTRQTISKYENGKSNPDMESLEQLTRIFNVDIDTLLYGDLSEERKRGRKRTIFVIALISLVFIMLSILIGWENSRQKLEYGIPYIKWLTNTIFIPFLLFNLGREIVRSFRRETALNAILIKCSKYYLVMKNIIIAIAFCYFILITFSTFVILKENMGGSIIPTNGWKESITLLFVNIMSKYYVSVPIATTMGIIYEVSS